MPRTLPANNATDFTPPPSGTHTAICYRVIDLGTQQVEFQGQVKHQRKIMISWELPDEIMEETGEPFTIHQRYTWSSNEKATLRKHLESWRGKGFSDEEVTQFDISKIIGRGCLLSIVHNLKNDRTYANISAVSGLPKGMTVGNPKNEMVFFDLDDFSADIFNGLSEGLRNIITKSPEYAEATGQAHRHGGPPSSDTYDERNMPPPIDDDIPF